MYQKHTTQLGRDPFARGNTVRRLEAVGTSRECAWCGAVRRKLRRNYPAGEGPPVGPPLPAFNYGWQSDGGRTSWHKEPFCSRSCARAFHGN